MKSKIAVMMTLMIGVVFVGVSFGAEAASEKADTSAALLERPVDELIRLAVENNPSIKVAEAQVQLAQAELARQRTDVALKVIETVAHRRAEQNKGGGAAPIAREAAERELRNLIGGDANVVGASAKGKMGNPATLDIKVGPYGEMTWEVTGLPIPEELRRRTGSLATRDEIFRNMWWLSGRSITATISAPVDLKAGYVSDIIGDLKTAGIESYTCLPTTEHMALPIVDKNLQIIADAMKQSFKKSVIKKHEAEVKSELQIHAPGGMAGGYSRNEASEIEAFFKEFQIPFEKLTPTLKSVTYCIELKKGPLVVSGNTVVHRGYCLGAFAELPTDFQLENSAVIEVVEGVPPAFPDRGFSDMPKNRPREEVLLSKSVTVPATKPDASDK